MTNTKKARRNEPAPLPQQAPLPQTRQHVSNSPGWGPLALEPGQGLPPVVAIAAVAKPAKAPRKRKGRTMDFIVNRYQRADGRVGFTFRELCPKLHVAAESLRAAIINPSRLSVASVVALADLMGEEPMMVLADILAEMKSNPNAKKAAKEKARSGKPKENTPAADIPAEQLTIAGPQPTAQAVRKATGKASSKKKAGRK